LSRRRRRLKRRAMADSKQDRLAAALRENLRRRKSQARAQAVPEPDPPVTDPPRSART
jgi:tRNA A37 threonylcarbamoyladenosine dehydratase